MLEIKWKDETPETGERRYLHAERFAGVWSFKFKTQRRGEWTKGLTPTKEMWQFILDALQRRYRRREGVSDEDIEQVERILKQWKEPRVFDEDRRDEVQP